MPTERQIDAAVRALALAGEPSRLRILWALSSDEMDVTSLATLARITATAASQHLAKLRLAGLVTARRQGRRVLYSAHRSHVRRLIAEALPPEWPLARIDPVLRAVMRAGAAELWTRDGPPAKVVINEYLDVAHGFFVGEEPRMANGVLNHLARLLRPAEFPPVPEPT